MRLQSLVKTYRVAAGSILTEWFGGWIGTQVQTGLVFPVYGPAVVVDCSLGDNFIIAVSNNVAFTVNAPTNVPVAGSSKRITVTIQNGAGAAHGVITWTGGAGGFRLAGALPAIANGQQRSLDFRWNGTAGLWQEIARTAADVANA